jgi:hypothetical protein
VAIYPSVLLAVSCDLILTCFPPCVPNQPFASYTPLTEVSRLIVSPTRPPLKRSWLRVQGVWSREQAGQPRGMKGRFLSDPLCRWGWGWEPVRASVRWLALPPLASGVRANHCYGFRFGGGDPPNKARYLEGATNPPSARFTLKKRPRPKADR